MKIPERTKNKINDVLITIPVIVITKEHYLIGLFFVVETLLITIKDVIVYFVLYICLVIMLF